MMSRDDALTFLHNRFTDFETVDGVVVLTNDDTASGYKDVIDDALMLMGTAHSDVSTGSVADLAVPAFRAALRVYALLKIVDLLGTKVSYNVSTGSVSESMGNVLKQALTLLTTANNQLKAYGYVIDAAQGVVQMREYRLDIYSRALDELAK